MSDNRERGKVKDGISVFDLIMPWKSDVDQSIPAANLQHEKLAKNVIFPKS